MNHSTIEKLQSFFFRAMLSSGWIGGGDIADSTEMPGYKVVSFFDEAEGLLLIDTWCSGDNGHSSGFTTIYMGRNEEQDGKPHFKWVPVWVMNYMGRYDDEAIEVVKLALQEAYRAGRFVGGRGPLHFEHNGWSYRNNLLEYSDSEKMFDFFRGIEDVIHDGKVHGYHRFWGMTLSS